MAYLAFLHPRLFILRSYPAFSFTFTTKPDGSSPKSSAKSYDVAMSEPFKPETTVSYAIRWDENKSTEIKIGDGPWVEIPIQLKPHEFSFSYSTGCVLFDKLVIESSPGK